MHHAFLLISLPTLHDYDVKMPNFTMTEEVHKQRPNFLLFLNLGMVLRNSTFEGSP